MKKKLTTTSAKQKLNTIYYLPFDKSGTFKNLIQSKFESGELVIIDKVIDEAKYISRGIVLQELPFINDKAKHVNTSNLIPNERTFLAWIRTSFGIMAFGFVKMYNKHLH